MKLHLGCGQIYLNGYVNIDFPLSNHSVQKKSVADIHADILRLKYKANTIDEIRLHHVFEHFSRPVACGLLVGWRSWLKIGGILRIEVPDFNKNAMTILNPLTSEKIRCRVTRHIFGSNEADWAVHFDGWSMGRLKKLLETLEFEIISAKYNKYLETYNFELIAKKNSSYQRKEDFNKIISNYLSKFLMDNSDSEKKLFYVWLGIYKKQLNITYST